MAAGEELTDRLTAGDPAPWFIARAAGGAPYQFNNAGGRYVVLCFFRSAAEPGVRDMLAALRARADVFDDSHASFFGVSSDPEDESLGRLQQRVPGHRYFWDFDLALSALYGVYEKPRQGGPARHDVLTLVLDPTLRVLASMPIEDPAAHAAALVEYVRGLPRLEAPEPAGFPAPVLAVPRVFEPEFCRRLIDYYEGKGGEDSGFMRDDASGKTVGVIDYGHKRRRDCVIEDAGLRQGIVQRLRRRLVPEIQRVFQFKVTRIERYIVACYDAEEGGYFRPHRDNRTKATAHRRFAVTINLNAEDYEGGDLRFPEYGQRAYRAPTGGAIVFSCSLLHEATPILKGRRYCTLPFLYDEAGARVRQENAQFLVVDT